MNLKRLFAIEDPYILIERIIMNQDKLTNEEIEQITNHVVKLDNNGELCAQLALYGYKFDRNKCVKYMMEKDESGEVEIDFLNKLNDSVYPAAVKNPYKPTDEINKQIIFDIVKKDKTGNFIISMLYSDYIQRDTAEKLINELIKRKKFLDPAYMDDVIDAAYRHRFIELGDKLLSEALQHAVKTNNALMVLILAKSDFGQRKLDRIYPVFCELKDVRTDILLDFWVNVLGCRENNYVFDQIKERLDDGAILFIKR